MYIDDIKLFDKNEKRIGNPNTGWEDIESEFKNGDRHRKMYHVNKEKHVTDGMELPNQDKIRTRGEKGTQILRLVGCLGLWHFNHCRLFNAKSIFMHIVSSIANNSV